MSIRRAFLGSFVTLALLAGGAAHADELTIVVQGVDGRLLENVQNNVSTFRLTPERQLNRRRLETIRSDAERDAAAALRPFGYYHPVITSQLEAGSENDWVLTLTIQPGPPLLVKEAAMRIEGDGATLAPFTDWQGRFPLAQGNVLDQAAWDAYKEEGLNLAEYEGFLTADFPVSRLEADLVNNEARAELLLDTGPQARMGEVRFRQDIVDQRILDIVPRFSTGDSYDGWLMEKFRIDLWNTGYFSNIEVVEQRDLNTTPPTVDLDVTLEPRKRDTWQGIVGYGSNTGPRLQLQWNRHRMSRRGDSFALGLGWQDINSEYQLRGNYRLPRTSRAREYWIADALLKRERREVRIQVNDEDLDFVPIGDNEIEDISVRLGRLKIRDLGRRQQQVFETMYVEALNERTEFVNTLIDPGDIDVISGEDPLLEERQRKQYYSLGIEWDWPVVRGSGFETSGHHEQARLFTAQEAWGSDASFTQAHFSSRWNFIRGRWKFLVRGEVGYSDAEVSDLSLPVEGDVLSVSLTELPNLYRFKAGGANSVRGYGWETLSNNGIGSNHIMTLSAEIEMKLAERWSAAVFFDAGNAFNDWSNMRLKKGAGVGVRWYTIAGAIRLDVAQALDLNGNPWRLHFTIGTPLL